ncbi:hypothetical protein [Saccharothrix hoggarensis]|uniref:Membrane protein (TIGR02234 family) n=1 Tax=Saccharothrix hoggarensis TaxID=913853 RepID=A0ABW3QUN4_9PSEU
MSRRLVGVAALVGAGAVAVVGTFRPLFWQGSLFRDERVGFTTTSWDITADASSSEIDLMLDQTPQFGVPIVISAVLLAIAAALVALPEAQRLAARYAAVVGTALLAGSVWTTGMVVATAVDDPDGEESPVEAIGGFTEEVGDGVWVLTAAVVLAVVGTVLVHGRRATPRPEGPVVYRVDGDGDGDDTDTPPFGIPVVEAPGVEVARIPGTGYDDRSGANGPA